MYRRRYNAPATMEELKNRAPEEHVTLKEARKPSRMMSVSEMMGELGICRKTAYQLVHEAGFPSVVIGRRILIDRMGLEEWLSLHRVSAVSDSAA